MVDSGVVSNINIIESPVILIWEYHSPMIQGHSHASNQSDLKYGIIRDAV